MTKLDDCFDLSVQKDNFSKNKHIASNLIYGKENITTPKISIIIPTYNRGSLLKRAIDSAIMQTYDDFEIVIGDNTTDESIKIQTEEMVNALNNDKIYYYQHSENLGSFGNWNRLIELARGEYVLMLHDDDYIDKDFLKAASRELTDGRLRSYRLRTVDERGGRNSRIKSLGKRIAKLFVRKKRSLKAEKMIFYTAALNLGTFYKRENMLKIGGYDAECKLSADHEMVFRYVYNFGGVLYKKAYYNYCLVENDSITASQYFPESGYLFKSALIEQLSHNIERDMKYLKYEYDVSLEETEKNWGLKCEDILLDSDHRKERLYSLKKSKHKFRNFLNRLFS